MSSFAWPLCICLTVLILGLVILFRHHAAISRFIDRTKHIGKAGVTTSDATALATQTEVKDTFEKPSAADELLKSFDNQLLVEQENLIKNFLKDKNIQSSAERERVLTRYLASSYLVNRFEGIYSGIFGSQLRALETLNESAPNGLPFAAVEAWYEFGKAGNPNLYGANGEYTFERWLSYMRRMTLVTTVDTNVHATEFGSEFLKYLIQNSYTMDKRG
jgi:hypothetical protein